MKTKKLLSLLLAAVMLITVIPTFALSASANTAFETESVNIALSNKSKPTTYTITYDANGGVTGENWKDSITVEEGSLIPFPDVAEGYIEPAEGMEFNGLYIDGDVTIDEGMQIRVTNDLYILFLWKSAEPVKDKWVEEDGKTYYYQDGEPLKGLQEIEGKNYIFSKATGELLYGKVRCDGKWYIMNKATGEMLYGKVRCDYKWYIMSKTTGEMLYGKVRCDGIWYIMSKSTGEMLYGKVTCDGKTYICSKADGHVFMDMDVTCDGIKYHCDKNGIATKR